MRRNGFGLLEAMVALAAGSLLLAIAINFFSHSRRLFISINQYLSAEQDALSVQQILNFYIHQAGFMGCVNLSEVYSHVPGVDLTSRYFLKILTTNEIPVRVKKIWVAGTSVLAVQGAYARPMIFKYVSPSKLSIHVNSFDTLKKKAVFIINNCQKAEVFSAFKVRNRPSNNDEIILKKPLLFSYDQFSDVEQWSSLLFFEGKSKQSNEHSFYVYDQLKKRLYELVDHIENLHFNLVSNSKKIVKLSFETPLGNQSKLWKSEIHVYNT